MCADVCVRARMYGYVCLGLSVIWYCRIRLRFRLRLIWMSSETQNQKPAIKSQARHFMSHTRNSESETHREIVRLTWKSSLMPQERGCIELDAYGAQILWFVLSCGRSKCQAYNLLVLSLASWLFLFFSVNKVYLWIFVPKLWGQLRRRKARGCCDLRKLRL